MGYFDERRGLSGIICRPIKNIQNTDVQNFSLVYGLSEQPANQDNLKGIVHQKE